MGVEKGTKAVISANFSVYGERTFNKLQRNFDVETPPKEFFNTHACFRQSKNRSTLIRRADMSIPGSGAKSTLRLFSSILVLLLLCGFVGCAVYLRLGTTLIGDFASPDGRREAIVMVRNGGAMTGFATVVSVSDSNWVARQAALFWPSVVFAADDNDGAVSWGEKGQIKVDVRWASNTQLIVAYPEKARVLRQERNLHSLSVQSVVSK